MNDAMMIIAFSILHSRFIISRNVVQSSPDCIPDIFMSCRTRRLFIVLI